VFEEWSVSLLGLVVGLRHAFEPDHLAAVGALVGGEQVRDPARDGDARPVQSAAFALGICWGLGHTAALFAVGGGLALLHVAMPAALSEVLELVVGGMLSWLGARGVVAALRAWRARDFGPSALVHARAHFLGEPHAELHVGSGACARGCRSAMVGLVHGLAGSGAITAVVLADLPDASTRLAYIVLFGLGSTAGMACFSGLAALPLACVPGGRRGAVAVSALTGVLSVGVGLAWATRVLRGWAGA
jgi:hypothetical protein